MPGTSLKTVPFEPEAIGASLLSAEGSAAFVFLVGRKGEPSEPSIPARSVKQKR